MGQSRKLETLLTQLHADHAKLGSRIDELAALLREELTPNQRAKRLLDSFCSKWQAKQGGHYIVNGPKDLALCRRVIDVPDILERMDRFLSSQSRFVVGTNYSLPVFIATVNDYGTHQRPSQLDPQVQAVCERAQLTKAEMGWFLGAQWYQNGGPLPTILMPDQPGLDWVMKFYGAKLAPYAELGLQEAR